MEKTVDVLRHEYEESVRKAYERYLLAHHRDQKNEDSGWSYSDHLVKNYARGDFYQVLVTLENFTSRNKLDKKLEELVVDSNLCYHRYETMAIKNAIQESNKEYVELIERCLKATVEGPFFPEWEFHTLFGLTRDEVKAVYTKWPEVDEDNQNVGLAIHNSFNNLTGYPHKKDAELFSFVHMSASDLRKKFDDWIDLTK